MLQGAGIVLILPDGRWAMQRYGQDSAYNPGKLGLFGGVLGEGETSEETLRRRLREETDLAETLQIELVVKAQLVDSGNGHPVYAAIFRAEISALDFGHHKGIVVEAYNVHELASRSDLTPVARAALSLLR